MGNTFSLHAVAPGDYPGEWIATVDCGPVLVDVTVQYSDEDGLEFACGRDAQTPAECWVLASGVVLDRLAPLLMRARHDRLTTLGCADA